jgi:hypothetical protein
MRIGDQSKLKSKLTKSRRNKSANVADMKNLKNLGTQSAVEMAKPLPAELSV